MEGSCMGHVADLHKDLQNCISQGKAPENALEEVKRFQYQLFAGYPKLLRERLEALDGAYGIIQERLNAVAYLEKRALRFGREHWYLGPRGGGGRCGPGW
jgi:hypothetical protein